MVEDENHSSGNLIVRSQGSKLGLFEERYRPKSGVNFGALHGDHTVRYIFVSKFVKENSFVLDGGCGYGYGSKYLADCGAGFVVGTDIDHSSLRCAKDWYDAGNLDFVVADGNHLPLRNSSFDVAASLEVIEHIDDHEGYLREIGRVLGKGGILVLSTPNKHHTDRTRLMPLYHIREFYPSTLSSLLKKYFTILHLYGKSISKNRTTTMLPSTGTRLRSAIARAGSIGVFRSILRRMPNLILHIVRSSLNTSYVPQLKAEDFEISESTVNEASNIIAVCRVADS